MTSEQVQTMVKSSGTDCSEIANKLLDTAGGKGKIIEIRPSQQGQLNVFENGKREPLQQYHQVYTDCTNQVIT